MVNVGIIGHGFVGKAIATVDCIANINIYDIAQEEYNSRESKIKAYTSDIVFISVPTDLNRNNRLDISILYECMSDYKNIASKSCLNNNTIVIKSTVPIGTCEELQETFNLNNIIFNPEFLTQRTAKQDFIHQKEIYLAGNKEHTSRAVLLYQDFFNYHDNKDYVFFEALNHKEFELLKLARNTFYGMKVSYCNYLYNLCKTIDVNYDSFRENFAHNEWVGSQHTYVPGPDDKLGYGGACLPKDSVELLNFFKKQGIIFDMLENSIDFNIKQRRKIK